MKKTILEILKEIETNENIDIIYACEAGSRVWGFAGEKSDYDVRFIYKKRDVTDYISLKKIDDVIEYKGDDFDIVGWDIKKAFTLLYKSNPRLREWLISDIVYIDRGISDFFSNLDEFDIPTLKNHYLSIAQKHWKRYSGLEFSKIKIKKYLYVLRSILSWNLLNQDIYPPININDLLNHENSNITDENKKDILNLIDYYLDMGEISEETVFRIKNFILKSLNSMKMVKTDSVKEIDDFDLRFKQSLGVGDENDG